MGLLSKIGSTILSCCEPAKRKRRKRVSRKRYVRSSRKRTSARRTRY